jgi:SAM-dependent methyltransferase
MLRCPRCGADAWDERSDCRDGTSGLLECSSCRANYLVVRGIPILTASIPGDDGRCLAERAEHDPPVRDLLRARLGSYGGLLGGFAGALESVDQEPLEKAFAVPGAPWINLRRLELPHFHRIAGLFSGVGTLVDLGCGYGASTLPFVSPERARAAVGIDENLFLLLLLRRYCEEKSHDNVALVCYDLEALPYPLRDGSADAVTGVSFFNHFASLRNRAFVSAFFGEMARIVEPDGNLVLDMVPNRGHPFPTEINIDAVISQASLEALARRVLGLLPLRWLPGGISASALWAAYSLYAALSGRPSRSYADFRRDLTKALPELGVFYLPLDPDAYGKVIDGFRTVSAFDQAHFDATGELARGHGWTPRTPYFLVRCTR